MKRASAFLAIVAIACAAPVSAQTLAARVHALEDREAIQQLVVADYATALDLMDMKAYASLFTSDGELSIGGMVLKGPENIEKMFALPATGAPPPPSLPLPPGVLPMPPMEGAMRPRMVPHVITNTSYHINGDTAEGVSYWMEIMLIEGRPGIVNMGHYEDRLRKVNGEWRFARRTIVRDVPIGTLIPAAAP